MAAFRVIQCHNRAVCFRKVICYLKDPNHPLKSCVLNAVKWSSHNITADRKWDIGNQNFFYLFFPLWCGNTIAASWNQLLAIYLYSSHFLLFGLLAFLCPQHVLVIQSKSDIPIHAVCFLTSASVAYTTPLQTKSDYSKILKAVTFLVNLGLHYYPHHPVKDAQLNKKKTISRNPNMKTAIDIHSDKPC